MSDQHNCYFCGKELDEDYECFGCGSYVCDDCDETMPIGTHFVEDHRERS